MVGRCRTPGSVTTRCYTGPAPPDKDRTALSTAISMESGPGWSLQLTKHAPEVRHAVRLGDDRVHPPLLRLVGVDVGAPTRCQDEGRPRLALPDGRRQLPAVNAGSQTQVG